MRATRLEHGWLELRHRVEFSQGAGAIGSLKDFDRVPDRRRAIAGFVQVFLNLNQTTDIARRDGVHIQFEDLASFISAQDFSNLRLLDVVAAGGTATITGGREFDQL